MVGASDNKSPESHEGIIVEAELEQIREGIMKVLFDFTETYETSDGTTRLAVGDIASGDAIVFKEDISPCPAEIVVIKIWDKQWYIISTSECPPEGCPDSHQAMRCARAEDKKLRILSEFLSERPGIKVQNVRQWHPDKLAMATNVMNVVDKAFRRWHH